VTRIFLDVSYVQHIYVEELKPSFHSIAKLKRTKLVIKIIKMFLIDIVREMFLNGTSN
jgi:hypothetical protein